MKVFSPHTMYLNQVGVVMSVFQNSRARASVQGPQNLQATEWLPRQTFSLWTQVWMRSVDYTIVLTLLLEAACCVVYMVV